MLNIIYFSNVTNNTHRFVENLAWAGETHRIPIHGEMPPTDLTAPYILICPTYGSLRSGHVPRQVKKFLMTEGNTQNLAGVIGSGNINFGDEYALAADLISQKFNVPLLYRFELAGTTTDIQKVHDGLTAYADTLTPQPLPTS